MQRSHSPRVNGLILAGGAARRMGGSDKGLIEYDGLPMVAHVSTRLRKQVDKILVSCNRNTTSYQQYADEVVRDRRDGYQGPLAGVESALYHSDSEFLLICPCDSPHLPKDLAKRLVSALVSSQTSPVGIAYAHDGARDQHLFAAININERRGLTVFLDAGGRSARDWVAGQGGLAVDFSDQQTAFRNYNTPRDLVAAAQDD